MANEAKFQLFATDPCSATLPVNEVVDTYEFERFAPLTINRDGREVKAVLPNNVAAPVYIETFKRNLPPHIDPETLRGGESLFPDWDVPEPPLEQLPFEFQIDSVSNFLANPRLTINDEEFKVELKPGNVRDLLAGEDSMATVRGTDIVREVRLRVSTAEVPANIPGRVVVNDLAGFISNPSLRLASGRINMQLKPANIKELAEQGASRVDLGEGEVVKSVFLVTRSVAGERDYVESTSMAMTTAIASPNIRTVEENRAGGIYQVDRPETTIFLPTFEFVLYLPYRQTWTLKGYSRGALLNSIPLAPQEETTIEIFTWDRLTRSQEDITTEEREATREVSFTAKETAQIMGECTTDNDWKLTVGGKVQLPPIEGISVGGGIDNETSESIKVVNKVTLDVVNEAVRRATARVKATRQTKVTESQEIGRESRVTRKLKNSNLCRPVIHDYFEVLASYEVKTVPLPDQIRLAVLVPNPFPEKVDRNFLTVNEGALRAALLDAKQDPGFLAARMLIAREHYCVLKCSQECKCPEPAKSSPASPSPQGATTGQPTPSVAGVEDPVTRARNRVMTADTTVRACINAIAAADTQNLASAYDRNATQSVKETAIREFRQYMLRTFGLEMFQASWWGECLAFTSSSASPERLERLLAAADGVWLETLIRGFFIGGLLAQFTIPFLVGKLIVKLGIKSGWYAQFIGFDDAGLGAAIGQARTELRLWRNAVSAQIVTTSAQPNQSITTAPEAKKEVEEVAETAEAVPFPLQSVAQWKVDEQALLMHIRNNISHYRRAIWEKMDPADRLNMLQLYGPLPNFVDNEVLGFVGDKVAVPFRTWVVGGLREVMADIVERLKQVVPEQAREVNMPTNGLHMESRLGTCDTCEEFIMKHRELDLQQKAAEVKAAEERAKQETLETERYQKRLQKKPPELDDPDPNQGQGEIRLLVKQEKQS